MDRITQRIQSLIDKTEAGEPIDPERESIAAGLEFALDSLDRQRQADEQLTEQR